jgi:hypothetical protein
MYQDKPWFSELQKLFQLKPEQLTRAIESHLFEEYEENDALPTHRIRAITVRNIKYIVSDFELA